MFLYLKNKKTKIIFGKLISRILFPKFKFYLSGNLGIGKTFLCKSIIGSLIKYAINIKSPTYNIMEKYFTHNFTLNHFDFYRIKNFIDIKIIDINLYSDENSINFMEWGNLLYHIPLNKKIHIILYYNTNIYDRMLILNSNIFILTR